MLLLYRSYDISQQKRLLNNQ